MDSGVIVKEFRNRFGSIIANGQGSMKGQIFRIAHLGYFDFADLFAVIAELEIILAANGVPVKFGTGVAAVQNVYAEVALAKETATPKTYRPMQILIAEPLATGAVKLLQQQPGWDVIVSNPKEYAQHLADADALIVRSAVTVNGGVLSAAPKLRVIGRAGVGVDNVDLPAATAAGVLVMNTPGGNAVSVAEHTLALMLSLARSIPAASASTKSGKWEKRKIHGDRAARKNARHRRPGQHRPRSGETRRGLRDAGHRQRSVCQLANRQGRRRGPGRRCPRCTPKATTSLCTPR